MRAHVARRWHRICIVWVSLSRSGLGRFGPGRVSRDVLAASFLLDDRLECVWEGRWSEREYTVSRVARRVGISTM